MEPCPETLKWGGCLGLSLPTCIWSNDPPSIHSFLSWLQGSGFRKGEHCHHAPLSLHVFLPVYALGKSHYFICHFLKKSKLAWDICNISILGKANILHSTTFSSGRCVGEGREPHGRHRARRPRVSSTTLFRTHRVGPRCLGLSFSC